MFYVSVKKLSEIASERFYIDGKDGGFLLHYVGHLAIGEDSP